MIDVQRELWVFELTVSNESLVAEGRERKQVKYQDLVEAGSATGCGTESIAIEVGSSGIVCTADFDALGAAVNALQDMIHLCLEVVQTTLLKSYNR